MLEISDNLSFDAKILEFWGKFGVKRIVHDILTQKFRDLLSFEAKKLSFVLLQFFFSLKVFEILT